MAPYIPLPHLMEEIDDLGLLDFLSLDSRATFITDTRPSAFAEPIVVFANDACQCTVSPVSSLLEGRTDGSEAKQWLALVRLARSGQAYVYDGTTWTVTILRGRWQVFTSTTTQSTVVKPPLSVKNVFDIALESNCISAGYYNQLIGVDWASTQYGAITEWTTEIKDSVSLLFSSPHNTCIFLGPTRDMLYNEPYSSSIKTLHSETLGSSAQVTFYPLWDTFEELILEVERTGRPTAKHDSPVHLRWNDNNIEETYFTFSFVPIKDAAGRVLGIFNQCFETTKTVVSQGRMMNLLRIRELTSTATSLDQFWQNTLRSFDYAGSEVPCAAIYTSVESLTNVNAPADVLTLEGSVGWSGDTDQPPPSVLLSQRSSLALAIEESIKASGPVLVSSKVISNPDVPFSRDENLSPEDSRIVICPLEVSSAHRAWIIIDVKLLRPYSSDYSDFIDLLTRQIVTGASAIALNNEERRLLELKAERAVIEKEKSELRFLEFAKHSPLGVYVLGPKGEVVFANEAWYDLNGLPSGSQGESMWRDRIHPDDLARVDATWDGMRNNRKDHAEVEFRTRRSATIDSTTEEDKYRYLSTTCFAELSHDGSLLSVTGLLNDLSVQKAHEREVADRLANALEAKRTQENFMDMVSHEMRNPLNAIIQCAEEVSQLLEPRNAVNDSTPTLDRVAALDAVRTILYCGNHQKQIIDDVLTISKLDANLLTLVPTPTVPISVARQVLQIFSSEIRSSGIKVSINPTERSEPVMFDCGRVLQILINLVGNAVKFLKGRERRELEISVSVSAEQPKPEAVVFVPSGRSKSSIQPVENECHQKFFIYYSVTDTGPGLSQEETHTLFGRFKQASPRTHAQYGGSGLGLFISRELSELHGGEIGLSSEPGVGSTFAFYVQGYAPDQDSAANKTALSPPITPPVIENQPSAVAVPLSTLMCPPSKVTGADSLHGTRVLIVEDNIINQTVLSRQLRRVGFEVTVTSNGEEALARLRDTPDVAIVLCDLEMPVMDGLTCVKHVVRLRKSGELPHLPMLAVTGNARFEQVQIAKDAGFDDVVCKPYSFGKLVPLMKSLIAGT